jgi:hypothetical protein
MVDAAGYEFRLFDGPEGCTGLLERRVQMRDM